MPPKLPHEFHPQDWALIAEALTQWAGPPDQCEAAHEERAYELIEAIADVQGLPPGEFIKQIDQTWLSGHSRP